MEGPMSTAVDPHEFRARMIEEDRRRSDFAFGAMLSKMARQNGIEIEDIPLERVAVYEKGWAGR